MPVNLQVRFKNLKTKNGIYCKIRYKNGPWISIAKRLNQLDQVGCLYHELTHFLCDLMLGSINRSPVQRVQTKSISKPKEVYYVYKTREDEEKLCEMVRKACISPWKKYLKKTPLRTGVKKNK